MCCNKRWVMAAALCGALAASAANVTLNWDATQRPATLGDPATGTLALTYNADEKIVKIVATPVDGGTIVVTGDQMDAVDPGTIELAAGGELVFSNKFVSGWNINVYSQVTNTATVTDARTISYSGNNIGTSYTTIFKNRRLEDWMPLTTGNSGGRGWWSAASSDNIPTYNIRWEADGSLTAQRQASLGKINDDYGNGVGIVKFQLKQDGDDIAGRAIYAGYWSQAKGPLGTDSDVVFADPKQYNVINQGVTEPTTSTGYGINKIKLSRVRGLPTVRFAGGLSAGGVLYAREYTHVVFERAVTGSIGYGYQADANGILTFRDPEVNFDPTCNAARNGALGLGVAGSGTVEFEATDALYGDEMPDESFTFTPDFFPSNEWRTVATDQQLANLTANSTAQLGGGSMNAPWRTKVGTIQLLKIAADGQTATGQFQYLFNPWTNDLSADPNRCAGLIVEFRQNGNDVQMRTVAARCFYNTTPSTVKARYGTDLSNVEAFTVSASNSEANYGIHDAVLQFSTGRMAKSVAISRYIGIRAMKGSTAVPGCKAQVVVRGTDKTVMRYVPATGNAHVLPDNNGILRIEKGGEALAQNTGLTSTNAMWSSDSASDVIRVEKDGVFRQQSAWGVGITQRVELVEGEFRAYDNSAITMGQCKLNLLTFFGNARLYSSLAGADDYVRAGYMQDAIWSVLGSAPSQCDVGLRLWAGADGNTMTFLVDDVATGTDFEMNGSLDVDATYPNVTVVKTGPGTMALNKAVNLSGRPLVLKGGTWLLGSATTTSAADPVTLDGGTLETAKAGTGLGVLTVGVAGGGITLGEGATLSFADSSAATWDTNKVVVTGFAEKSIRFGEDADALTAEQQKRFRTNEGKRLYLNDEGYLTRQIGMTIFIR